MLLIRRMEERLGEVVKSGELPGSVHLYIGQEAVAVGVCSQLTEQDWIASTHRGHGHFLAKGGDPHAMIAEIFGRATGICHGKGGSMHVADFSQRHSGRQRHRGRRHRARGGCGTGRTTRRQRRVAAVFFGDGGANQGVVMEAINLAAIWKLPLLLVCENNGFSEFSPTGTVTAGEIAARAQPFGVPGVPVDGNDVLAVRRDGGCSAIARARAGRGPDADRSAHVPLARARGNGEELPQREVPRGGGDRDTGSSAIPSDGSKPRFLSAGSASQSDSTAVRAEVDRTVERAYSRGPVGSAAGGVDGVPGYVCLRVRRTMRMAQ